MIVCTKNRTFMRGSIVGITYSFANIATGFYKFLCRHMGSGSAATVVLTCVKAALEESPEDKVLIMDTLIEGRMNSEEERA